MTDVKRATLADAPDILELQKLCYQSEAKLYNDFTIPPLTQNLSEIKAEFARKVFFKVSNTTVIASVRAFLDKGTCHIARLIVHPDFQGKGLGTTLMKKIEAHFDTTRRFVLFTGSKSEHNIRLYERLGYVKFRESVLSDSVTLVFLEKRL